MDASLITSNPKLGAIAVGENEAAEVQVVHWGFGTCTLPKWLDRRLPREKLQFRIIHGGKLSVNAGWGRPVGLVTKTWGIAIACPGIQREGKGRSAAIGQRQSHIPPSAHAQAKRLACIRIGPVLAIFIQLHFQTVDGEAPAIPQFPSV